MFLKIHSWSYAVLIKIYPPLLRRQFGTEMRDLFNQQIVDMRQAAGANGLIRIWISVGEELVQIVIPYYLLRLSVIAPTALGVTFSLLLFIAGLALFESIASAGAATGDFVNVSDHRLFVECTGKPSPATIILGNGAGAGHQAWRTVQLKVAQFARVCSYDRAGEGQSDKPTKPVTPDSVVEDLHRLLEIDGISGPYVLVGASLGGIYVRRFTDRYPDLVQGMVLVDSSHEEQYNLYKAISPTIAQRFATQDGRFDKEDVLRTGGQLPPGQKLQWHHDIPLIVLEHQRPGPQGAIPLPGQSEAEANRLAADLHSLQEDLASRSRYGELREAHSGHFIAGEQPEIVVKAIQDVLNKIQSLQAR